jgi:hypothetical protein
MSAEPRELKRINVTVASDKEAGFANDDPAARVFAVKVSGMDDDFKRRLQKLTSLQIAGQTVVLAGPGLRVEGDRLFVSAPDDQVEAYVAALDQLFEELSAQRDALEADKQQKADEWRKERDAGDRVRAALQERLNRIPPPPGTPPDSPASEPTSRRRGARRGLA